MSKDDRCTRHPEWGPVKENKCVACLTERAESAEDRCFVLEAALRPFAEGGEDGIHRIAGWAWRQRHPRWREKVLDALGIEVSP